MPLFLTKLIHYCAACYQLQFVGINWRAALRSMLVKEKFLLSDMINSPDIEIILKVNVTRSKKKRTSCLSLFCRCSIFICIFFSYDSRIGDRESETRNYGAIIAARRKDTFLAYRLSRRYHRYCYGY